MRLSGQFQDFFFYKKVLNAQKAPKYKTNNFQALRSLCAQQTVAFVVFFLLVFVLVVGFCLICVFVRLEYFRKKKKRLEIVLITQFTVLLICTPINPLNKNLFVHTYFYL